MTQQKTFQYPAQRREAHGPAADSWRNKLYWCDNLQVAAQGAKSFHLDSYCFDSDPERNLFWDLLRDGHVNFQRASTRVVGNRELQMYIRQEAVHSASPENNVAYFMSRLQP